MSVPDCLACGACCREAFDCTPLTADEAVRITRDAPTYVDVQADGWVQLVRVPSPRHPSGTQCAALRHMGSPQASYTCDIYAQRPEACSLLDAGSESCHLARKRVGLEPWEASERPHGPLFR